ncbi:MAG: ABC transporter permease subunit, partial [Chloroflexota bacterium]
GIMDVTLSLPIPRWRIIVERMLAYALLLTGIALLTFLIMAAAVAVTPSMDIAAGTLFQATINIVPSLLLVLAFTVLVSAALPRRGLAIALAIIFLVGSYFIDSIGSMASGSLAASLKAISFYSYYDGSKVVMNGLNPGSVLLLLVVTVIFAAASLWFFERRDIA